MCEKYYKHAWETTLTLQSRIGSVDLLCVTHTLDKGCNGDEWCGPGGVRMRDGPLVALKSIPPQPKFF